MGLAGQGNVRPATGTPGARVDDAGYVMVVLLIAMAVTAVWMTAALPSWRQRVIREREAELVFRGEAIARAIFLYRQKNGQALPPSIDILVSQRYLRKKYIDPITGKDFLVVGGAAAVPGGAGRGAAAPAGGPAMQGGIVGVRSTSNDASIRIYNNQQTYSQWAFDFTLEQLRSGAGAPAAVPTQGGRGGRQQVPGELAPIMPGGRGGTGAVPGRGQPGSQPGRGGGGFGGQPPGRGGP